MPRKRRARKFLHLRLPDGLLDKEVYEEIAKAHPNEDPKQLILSSFHDFYKGVLTKNKRRAVKLRMQDTHRLMEELKLEMREVVTLPTEGATIL